MSQCKPVHTIRMSRSVAELVATWSSTLNMTPPQFVEMAIKHCVETIPAHVFGTKGEQHEADRPRY
ncbi:hypothetical protein D3C84_813360 [compost metagenome]